MKYDKGFEAKHPMPPTEAEKAGLAAVVRAIRALPSNTVVQIDDHEGTVSLLRRESPGFARGVGETRVAVSRVRF